MILKKTKTSLLYSLSWNGVSLKLVHLHIHKVVML